MHTGFNVVTIAENIYGYDCYQQRTGYDSKGGPQCPRLTPGCAVEFIVNREGDVVLHKAGPRTGKKADRFEAARGKAQIKWRTDELMALLRGSYSEVPW